MKSMTMTSWISKNKKPMSVIAFNQICRGGAAGSTNTNNQLIKKH
jgi:hypothetical protein